MTGNDIFRRRLEIGANPVENRTRKGASRCLFGNPNPVENLSVENAVFSKNRWCFERHWNFSMAEALSTTHPIVPVMKPQAKLPKDETKFHWDSVYKEDQMAECDKHRMSVPVAPNARPVSLFFAPVIPVKSESETEATTVKVETKNSPIEQTDNPAIVPNKLDELPCPPCIDNQKIKEELPKVKEELRRLSPKISIPNEVSPISRLVSQTVKKVSLPSPPLTEVNLPNRQDLKTSKLRTSSSVVSPSKKGSSNSESVMSGSNGKRTSSRYALTPNLSSELRLRNTKSHGVIDKADSPLNKISSVHNISSVGPMVLAKRRGIIDYMRMKKSSRGKRI